MTTNTVNPLFPVLEKWGSSQTFGEAAMRMPPSRENLCTVQNTSFGRIVHASRSCEVRFFFQARKSCRADPRYLNFDTLYGLNLAGSSWTDSDVKCSFRKLQSDNVIHNFIFHGSRFSTADISSEDVWIVRYCTKCNHHEWPSPTQRTHLRVHIQERFPGDSSCCHWEQRIS